MIELAPFLKQLITLPGLSGYEAPVREFIAEAWRPLVDELSISRLGSLHGLKRGVGDEPRRRILLSAHMDAIGLMVTTIVDGLLHITEIGGVDQRILPGQLVTVHGRRDLPGVVAQPPDRLLPPDQNGKPVKLEHLLVDTGLLPDEVMQLVRPGDLVSFASEPLDLAGGVLAGHSLDDRAAVAAVTLCLQELQHMHHSWDVWAVASVQEEETLGGALTSPFAIRPDMAVAIDVTFAKGPGSTDYRTYALDSGPTIGWGSNVHPALHRAFKELALKIDLPHHIELMPEYSGTDAMGIQIVAEGIPCAVIGIPLRYMHTPVEEVSLRDITRAGHLLASFITNLEPDFVEKISWDEPSDNEGDK
jgi:tetrahedral aminopeptidase